MKNKFFELLIQNNQKKIHEHIVANGKRKPICPIRFISREELDDGERKRKDS